MKKSAALKYNSSLPAPVLTAKGSGLLADKIIRIAEKEGIAVVEDSSLASSLFLLDIGDIIPEKHYKAVAEILCFIINL